MKVIRFKDLPIGTEFVDDTELLYLNDEYVSCVVMKKLTFQHASYEDEDTYLTFSPEHIVYPVLPEEEPNDIR